MPDNVAQLIVATSRLKHLLAAPMSRSADWHDETARQLNLIAQHAPITARLVDALECLKLAAPDKWLSEYDEALRLARPKKEESE